MSYIELPPPPAAADHVDCIWLLDGAAPAPAAATERIVPDGCAEVIVQRADVYAAVDADGRESPQPRAFVAGMLSRGWTVRATGAVRTLGIRVRPGALGAFLGDSAERFSDRATPLDLVWGSAGRELLERVAGASSDPEAVAAAAGFVEARCRRLKPREPAVAAAVAAIMRAGGRRSIAAVAGESRLGVRALERRFRDAVGLSPKTLARIARFRTLLERLRAGGAGRLAHLAAEAGFYDHAHLVRDFQAFTGRSPSRYALDEGLLAPCFASPDRAAGR